MADLPQALAALAEETGFSGVVRVDRGDATELAVAYGLARRDLRIPNTVDTQLALASGNKSFTALAVMRLVEQGTLSLDTTARSMLGDDLPLIRDDVTVEQLLANRSGIGDYIDEEGDGELSDYVMPVPVHELATTEQFLAVLDGFPTKFAPDERFSYCNGGFMVLALIAERAAAVPYHDLVHQTVLEPAGMIDTAFLRSDDLPGRAAYGYVTIDGDTRTNVFHLPVRGNGDGGAYSTVADIRAFWPALFAGRIVSLESVAEMVQPRSDVPEEGKRYGLGFWLHRSLDAVMLVGCDAGVSFQSVCIPESETVATVISNTAEGAWPVVELLETQLGLA